MKLEVFAFPVLGTRHHFIDVLVILRPVAQRRPGQPDERAHENCRGDANLDISVCHKDFRGNRVLSGYPDYPQDSTSTAARFNASLTRAIVNQTTLENEPSITR